MKSAREGMGALIVVLVVAVFATPSIIRAQESDIADEAPTDSEPAAKMAPTLSTFYSGDITFQNIEMGASISDVVQHGKNFSGVWSLAPDIMTVPTEIGPFKGKLVLKSKIKATMTLQFPSDSFPHCRVQLTGASTDEGFSFTGTAKETKCGKDGKELGKGTFFLTAG